MTQGRQLQGLGACTYAHLRAFSQTGDTLYPRGERTPNDGTPATPVRRANDRRPFTLPAPSMPRPRATRHREGFSQSLMGRAL